MNGYQVFNWFFFEETLGWLKTANILQDHKHFKSVTLIKFSNLIPEYQTWPNSFMTQC